MIGSKYFFERSHSLSVVYVFLSTFFTNPIPGSFSLQMATLVHFPVPDLKFKPNIMGKESFK